MEIVLGALCAWGVIMLLWTLIGVLLLPLGRELPLTVVVRCQGDAPWLEHCLRALVWLRDSGILWWQVVILDQGLTQEGRDRAARLARDQSQVILLDPEDVKDWMESEHGTK
jgi:hypothetical protein